MLEPGQSLGLQLAQSWEGPHPAALGLFPSVPRSHRPL